MNTSPTKPLYSLKPLFIAWAALIILTMISVLLGQILKNTEGLTEMVAGIIWLKAWLVAYFFLEASHCHTFIRRLVFIFIAYAPILLVLTDLYGERFAAWVTL